MCFEFRDGKRKVGNSRGGKGKKRYSVVGSEKEKAGSDWLTTCGKKYWWFFELERWVFPAVVGAKRHFDASEGVKK